MGIHTPFTRLTSAARAQAGEAQQAGERSRWDERAGAAAGAIALVVCVMLLDTIPLSAWLAALATVFTGDPKQAALPLWYLGVLEACALVIGYLLRRARAGLLLVAAAPGLALGTAGAIWLSPAGIAVVSQRLWPPPSAFVEWAALLGLCGYLWWRGLRWSRGSITVDDLLPLFGWGLAGVVLALLASAGVHGPGRGGLDATLFALLVLQTFTGLVALALARAGEAGIMRRGVWANRRGEGSWLRLALALATIVVGVTLALGLVFARQDLLAVLAPLGWLVDTLIEWVAFVIFVVIYFVFHGPLSALTRLFKTSSWPAPLRPKSTAPLCRVGPCTGQQPLPPWVDTAMGVVALLVVLLLVVGLIYLAYRVLAARRALDDQPQDDVEARASLDGTRLLRTQLATALEVVRRALPERADLPPGSVRRVYRDVLRAATAAELAREPSETPDEYAARLNRWVGTADDQEDVAALTGAYNHARYGEREPGAPEQADLSARGRRIRARLRAHGRRPQATSDRGPVAPTG